MSTKKRVWGRKIFSPYLFRFLRNLKCLWVPKILVVPKNHQVPPFPRPGSLGFFVKNLATLGGTNKNPWIEYGGDVVNFLSL